MIINTAKGFLRPVIAMLALMGSLAGIVSAQAPTGPQPRTGRFYHGAGDDPTYHAFVIPLDFQKGVQLSPTGIAPWTEGQPYAAYPWFFKVTQYATYLLQNSGGTVTYPLELHNPIAAFGSESSGSPMYIGQSFRFAFHVGGQSAITDVADELKITVYNRSNFQTPAEQAPILVQPLDIPHWKDTSVNNSADAWKQFGDSGFQKTFVTTVDSVPVLETTVQLAFESGPAGMFGAGYVAPFIITHRALPGAENYYFSVSAVGSTKVGSNVHWMAVADPAQPLVTGTHILGYAMNFEVAPSWGTTLLQTPSFQGEPAPPTYYGKTAEEINALAPRFEHQFSAPAAGGIYTQLNQAPELQAHSILDRFVAEMGNDPMALVNYVHNEIGLTDALGYNENGDIDEASVNAGGINRSALATFQEGQGSPDEQCALLVYLLRKAGVPASYVRPSPGAVKMLDQRLSNLLRMRLKGMQTPDGGQPVPEMIGVNYPWVAAYVTVNGTPQWVHLFPWLKDTEVVEGLTVEGYLPSGTKSIREWVRKYLKADATDPLWTLDAEDRTPGNIFMKDLDKSLQEDWPGLSRDNMGVRFRDRKFNRVKWTEFPQPNEFDTTTAVYSQSDKVSSAGSRFDTIDIEIVNDQDANKKIVVSGLRIADLHNRRAIVNFLPGTAGNYTMRFALEPYDLDNPGTGNGDFSTAGTDPYLLRRQVKDVAVNNAHKSYQFKVTYHRQRNYGGAVGTADEELLGGWSHFAGISNIDFGPGGAVTASSPSASVFSLGDLNAFCLNAGRVTDRMLKVHLEPFWKHEQARAASTAVAPDYDLIQGTTAYLMGMSYYQRVSRSFETLKNVFKVHAVSMRAHGFAQFGAKKDGSGNPVVANAPLVSPATTPRVEQVYPVVDMNFSRTTWAGYGDIRPDAGGQGMITGADFMTNLFIAEISSLEDHTIDQYIDVTDTDAVSTVNLIHRVQQDGNAGTNVIELDADNYLTEKTKSYTFNGTTKTLAAWAGGMWTSVETAFTGWDKNLVRVYITPGPVTGAAGQWSGMGALIIGKGQAGALIGRINGGAGYEVFSIGNTYSLTQKSVVNSTLAIKNGDLSYIPGVGYLGNSVVHMPSTYTSQSVNNYASLLTTGTSSLSFTDTWFNSSAGLSGVALGNQVVSNFSQGGLLEMIGVSTKGTYKAPTGISLNVGDPVNMITGELYADEVDLTLPGPIPLQIRRNYSSQSPTMGHFGYGWKLAYFPYMVPTDSGDKLQVAELDGSVIIYARNTANTLEEEWIVKTEDNPQLTNGSGMEIGSVRNLFRNRIVRTSPGGVSTYTLSGADGSTRVYEVRSYPVYGATPAISRQRPYLKRWSDSVGNYLEFRFFGDGVSGDPWNVPSSHSSYGELARVQASNGNFYGFKYDIYGHITEVFTGDGRRIYYRYDEHGDLVEVTLPDKSWAKYDYLHEQGKVGSTNNLAWYSTHLIKRETRPGGRAVESDYQLYVQGDTDMEGNAIGAGSDKIGKASHLRRVTLQRATVGKHNGGNDRTLPASESYEPVRNATYAYFNTKDANGKITGRTEILDAYNRKTIYYYTDNRISKIFDPLSTVTNAAAGTGSNPKMEQEWYTAQDVTNSVPGAFAGGLKATQHRGGVRTEFGYNASGDVVEVRHIGDLDGDGVATDTTVTTATYNSQHLPVLITHPDPVTGQASGKRTQYLYQDGARPYLVTRVESQDPSGNVLVASTMSYQDVYNNPANQSQVPFAKGLVEISKAAEGTADEAETELAYDARGLANRRVAYSGHADQTNYPNVVTEFVHNLRGELVEERVMDGATAKKTSRYAYDDMGRAIWAERLNESGQQIAWDYTYYNLAGEVEWTDSSRTNPEDYTYMRYDGAGRAVEQVVWRSRAKADGSGVEAIQGVEQFATTKFYYNLFGDLIKTIDPRGHTVKAEYDDIGRKTKAEAYQGDWQSGGTLLAQETIAYDDAERKITRTDAKGGTTETYFTSYGGQRRQVNPDGTQLEWRYFLDGRVKRQPLSEHQYREFTYNDATRTVTKAIKNTSGNTLGIESTTVDRRGNVVSATNLVSFTVTSTYDKLNRLIATSVPASGSTSAAQNTTTYYDVAGMRTKTVNALGESSETLSDALGRPTSSVVRNAANGVVRQSSVTYSVDFHRLTATTGSGGDALVQSVWTDNAGRTVLVKHADNSFARTDYDAGGNAIAITDETGQTTQMGYDGLNRVSAMRLPDGALTQFVYTYLSGGGQKIERRMPQSLNEVEFTDSAGRPIERYLLGAGSVQSRRYHSYQYYTSGAAKGMLQQYTDPRGLVHSAIYDEWQRTATTTAGTVGSAAYVKREMLAYDVRGQITQLRETTNAAVTEVLSQYDGQGHLEYEKTKLDGEVVTHLNNTYNAAGQRLGLARGVGDIPDIGSGVGGSWSFGYRADGLLAGVSFGGSAFNYVYGDNGLLKTRSNPFRTYTVPNSGGRDIRGRLLVAQTRLTGRGVDVLSEAMTWTSDSRQNSYAAIRLTAADGTGTATWQDARSYQYNAERRQLVSESWVPGDGQSAKTQVHEHDFGQSGGLGIYTGRQAPAPSGSSGYQMYLVNDASMSGGAGVDAFGRVTREVSGYEQLGLTAQGTAKGAKDVELSVNSSAELSNVEFPAATRATTGAWQRSLWLPAGGYSLLAKGNHPSGQFSAQDSISFNLGVRHVAAEVLYDSDGNVTHRHVAGGVAGNGRTQTLTWDGVGRLVKVVQEEFGGFGFEWTAVYDGLNRRLQTTYVPKRAGVYQAAEQVRERSWFDPLVEFLELGLEVKRGSGGTAVTERWWKVHGPDLSGGYGGLEGMGGLEALVDEASGQAVGTTNDAYGHIIGFAKAATLSAASSGNLSFEWNHSRFGGYGPLAGNWSTSIADGLSVWKAFGWRGKKLDPTGYYHLGERYYEPIASRFLSTDPMGHGASMSLYEYAGGDPINFVDPQGRSALQIWDASVTGSSNSDWLKPEYIVGGTSLGVVVESFLLKNRAVSTATAPVSGAPATPSTVATPSTSTASSGAVSSSAAASSSVRTTTVTATAAGASAAVTTAVVPHLLQHAASSEGHVIALSRADYALQKGWITSEQYVTVMQQIYAIKAPNMGMAQGSPDFMRNFVAQQGTKLVTEAARAHYNAQSTSTTSSQQPVMLYRGVPGDHTERGRLGRFGIARPRGTRLDPQALMQHVLNEDVIGGSGVTSWTPFRAVAKTFSGSEGTIIQVPLDSVKTLIVPRPWVWGKYQAEHEVLLRGEIKGTPTKP